MNPRYDIQVGQMLVVIMMMGVYPRRAESAKESDDMRFNAYNDKVYPGDVMSVVERSEPRFYLDDVWYKVITQGGLVAWVRAHHWVFGGDHPRLAVVEV